MRRYIVFNIAANVKCYEIKQNLSTKFVGVYGGWPYGSVG